MEECFINKLNFFDRLIFKFLYKISNTHFIAYLLSILVFYIFLVIIAPNKTTETIHITAITFFTLIIELGLIYQNFKKEFKEYRSILRLKRIEHYKLEHEKYLKRVEILRAKGELYT